MKNRITDLFNIKYPIIQGGMIWVSGWKLASAVSNAGGLGLLGAGSMSPDVLREHILKCKKATDKPFGVNVPMLYSHIEEIMDVIVEEEVKIVFTSAGNPSVWTTRLKDKGITVVHVVSNLRFAIKSQNAGVDAIVAEGFEAGGHNGREETTSIVLVPTLKEQITVPIIAAGGIYSGKSMLAMMILGAEGVQIGSRFAVAVESSAHENYKKEVLNAGDGDTYLTLKEFAPVRLLKNDFFKELMLKYENNATRSELSELLGRGRSKKGMFEGIVDEGELEIGQVSSLINQIVSSKEIINDIVHEYNDAIKLQIQL
ncbi:MAG: nitronate monooxygenase [Flavobacteriales bacterium]|nr:nitronate monooxygenase [Flavobacteriales bacterium]